MAKNVRSGSTPWEGSGAKWQTIDQFGDKPSDSSYYETVYSTPNNKARDDSDLETNEKNALWEPEKIWEKNADSLSVVQKMGNDARDERWILTVKGVDFCFYRILAGKFSMGFGFDQKLSKICEKSKKCDLGKKRGHDPYPFCPNKTGSFGAKCKARPDARPYCSRNKARPLYCYNMSDAEALGRTVKITRDFWLMDTAVTVAAFDVFLRATGRGVPEGAYGYDAMSNEIRFDKQYNFMNPGFPNFERSLQKANYPATCVDWCDATAFCDWLTQEMRNCRRENVGEGKTLVFRLPTEAEWEWACRCGTSEAYSFGDNVARLAKYGNYDGKDGFPYVAPVKSFLANDFGLFDMHGNVWEWCSDWYAPYAATWFFPLIDPSGPDRGVLRSVRGGSWNNVAQHCRSATRGAAAPWVRAVNLGFRVAMDVYEF